MPAYAHSLTLTLTLTHHCRELLLQSLPVLRGAARFFLQYMWTDREGRRHTGPTTSPENSYSVAGAAAHKSNVSAAATARLLPPPKLSPGRKPKPEPAKPKPATLGFLTFSPAIDESILRQLANGYRLLIDWQRSAGGADEASAAEDDELHARLAEAVRAMPGGGLPLADARGTAREYPPRPFPHAEAGSAAAGEPAASEIGEAPDPAHRHFSPLHWVYPNPFAPAAEDLFDAARRLLETKVGLALALTPTDVFLSNKHPSCGA